MGIFFGGLFALFLYNIFIAVFLKETGFWAYLSFVACSALTFATLEGFDFQFLFPDNPWWHGRLANISATLTSISFAWFTQEYLNLNTHFPSLRKIWNFFIASSLLILFWNMILSEITIASTIASNFIIMAVIPFGIVLGIASLKKTRNARFYVGAYFLAGAGSSIWVFQNLNILPSNTFTQYAVFMGVGFEKILLSMGLADRMNTMRFEKEKAEKDLIRELKHNIEHLQILAKEGRAIASSLTMDHLVQTLRNSLSTIYSKLISLDLFPVTPENQTQQNSAIQIPVLDTDNKTIAILASNISLKAEEEKSFTATLDVLAASVTIALNSMKAIKNKGEQKRMEVELVTAQAVQRELLPKLTTIVDKSITLSYFYKTATECGGDWLNYTPLKDGRFFFILGDVTGHGAASAILVAVVKGYCDAYLQREQIDLLELCSQLSSLIFNSSDGELFMTAFVGIIDSSSQQLQYVSAAHPRSMLVRQAEHESAEISILNHCPIQLGQLIEETELSYMVSEIKLQDKDRLCIFSDGLIEGTNKDDKPYSYKRLKKLLQQQTHLHAEDLCHLIEKNAFDYFGGKQPDDDISFMIVEFQNLIQI